MTDQPTEAAREPILPPLPPHTCDATTGHSMIRKDDDLQAWGLACFEAGRAARALTQGEPPEGFEVVFVKGFGELMYWLDRCSDKGHLENCADLIEPYEAFDWRRPEAAAPSALVASPVEMQANMAPMIAGALFDFLGFLTTSEEQWKFSAYDEAGPAVIAIEQWAAKKGLSLDEANVSGWRASLAAIPVAASQLAKDFPPTGGLTECDMGDSYE